MPPSPKRRFYERLVHEHAAELERFAFRLCGSRAGAEDLVQETYTEAWSAIDRMREPERARAWLFQILRHRWARSTRAASRRPIAIELDDGARSEENDAERFVEHDRVQRALETLDDRFKLPLLMVFLQGLTCQETADELDLPLGTVLSRIHRARAALRELFADDTSEPDRRVVALRRDARIAGNGGGAGGA